MQFEKTITKINPNKPMIAGMATAGPFVKSANATPVCSFGTTKPQFCNPIKAINNPIPAGIAVFKHCGKL